MTRKLAVVTLAGDEVPTAFRIFTAGHVVTSKGSFIFDDAAAASVMTRYADQGNELMIDYDHAAVSDRALDPAHAGKAAGWFNLELRDGELWAVNVRFTPVALAAVRRKEWRYMSPCFGTDKDGRITDLVNVALTNLPATKKLTPLIAASGRVALGGSMDPDTIKKAIAAIKDADSDAALALLEGMIAEAAGAESTDAPADEPAEDDEILTEGEDEEKKEMAGDAVPEEKKDEETTKLGAKGVDVELAKEVQTLSARLQTLEAEREAERRSAFLATRPDLAPELRKTLSDKPLAVVREIVNAIPKPKAPAVVTASQTKGTRGADQGGERTSRLSVEQKAQMDMRMGLVESKKATVHDGAIMRLGVTQPKGAQ